MGTHERDDSRQARANGGHGMTDEGRANDRPRQMRSSNIICQLQRL